MDSARADMLSARHRLRTRGWIARHAEHFRHLPPPAAELWLGGTDDEACEAHPLAGAGWTLHPIGDSAQGRVEARWLDGADARQRAELLAGLPVPEEGDDAAPFTWAHRALCRHGLRLRIGGDERTAANPTGIVWLQLRHQPRAAVEAPLLVLDLQPGAQVVLVERHERDATACSHAVVQNLQVHVRLGEGAVLRHLRIVAPGPQDSLAHHLHLRLARGARHALATLAAGSRYVIATARAVPSGKQNTFAAHNLPQFFGVCRRHDGPMNLANAFEAPISPRRDTRFAACGRRPVSTYLACRKAGMRSSRLVSNP